MVTWKLLSLVLMAGLCYGGMAFAEDKTVGDSVDEVILKTRIETTYALNDSLRARDISTEVDGSTVTLTGTVPGRVEKDLAKELALAYDGVDRVVNNLEIDPEAAPEEPPEWRQDLDDVVANANIRRRLASHAGIKALTLDVNVEGTTAHVSGTVESEDQRDLIIDTVSDTRGIDKVESDLKVDADAEAAAEPEETEEGWWQETTDAVGDWWIQTRVQANLAMSRSVQLRDLDVEVENGVCVLTGTASSQAEKDLAEAMAGNVRGVEEVVNRIEVVG